MPSTTKPTPANAIDAAKARLSKIDQQLAHADAQLAATKADADQAYQRKDQAALTKLFARTEALERQRQDYAADRDAALTDLRAEYQPQVDAVAAEARALVDGWLADQQGAVQQLQEVASALQAAVAALGRVADERTRGRALAALRLRLGTLQADAGGELALPDLPDAPPLPSAEVSTAFAKVQGLSGREAYREIDAKLRGRQFSMATTGVA